MHLLTNIFECENFIYVPCSKPTHLALTDIYKYENLIHSPWSKPIVHVQNLCNHFSLIFTDMHIYQQSKSTHLLLPYIY